MRTHHRLQIGLVALGAAFLLPGCGKSASSAATTPSKGGGGAPAQMSLRRVIDRSRVQNDFRQLALYYANYSALQNRSPGKLDDLKADIERDMPKLYKAIEDGDYVVIWSLPHLSSEVVLAYEKEPDENGLRWVAHGDGSVKRLPPEEFEKALKAK